MHTFSASQLHIETAILIKAKGYDVFKNQRTIYPQVGSWLRLKYINQMRFLSLSEWKVCIFLMRDLIDYIENNNDIRYWITFLTFFGSLMDVKFATIIIREDIFKDEFSETVEFLASAKSSDCACPYQITRNKSTVYFEQRLIMMASMILYYPFILSTFNT